MKKKTFGTYCDKKKRESVRHLRLVKQILERTGMKVDNFLETEGDPYIFCHNPSKNGSFDGIRLYKIGEGLAYRIQKESKTHPYGSAYQLPIEDMFQDFLSDNISQKKAGIKLIETVGQEIRKFFEKSIEAERDERRNDIEKDNAGAVLVRTTGTDYSSLISNRT